MFTNYNYFADFVYSFILCQYKKIYTLKDNEFTHLQKLDFKIKFKLINNSISH